MPANRVLVFGRVGQLGWELRHKLACLGQVISIDYPDVDFTQPESIRQAVRKVEPTAIVNAAAYTAVDKAEGDFEKAAAINGAAPGVIAEEAKRQGCILVHYSTDYVFDGAKQDPYVESDGPNPVNAYGRSKLAGDLAIQAAGGDYLIFRTSWVYGARGSNFLLTMLRLAKERTELRIVDDQIGAPTSSECIAQATAMVLSQLLAPAGGGLKGRAGIYNFTCSGAVSWFGFAQALLRAENAATGLALPNLIPIKTAEFPTPAKRPANSRLCCRRLEETFGIALPSWQEALSLVMETLHEGSAHSAAKP
jgi:dTDP-4-dehydrorhamnose reductase